MILTLGKDNKIIQWIKNELIKDGNRKVKELYSLLPEEFMLRQRTFEQYVSYVKTNLLDKHIVYKEKELSRIEYR